MERVFRGFALLVLVLLIGYSSSPVRADVAQTLTDSSKPLIVGAIAYNYLAGEKDTAARASDALLISYAAAEGIKELTKEKRPDGTDLKSFPSGHTAAAFAVAGVLAKKDSDHKWLYYGVAAGIGWSRVELHKHYWKDVLGGVVLGTGVADWSVSSKDGLLISRVFKF